MSEKSAQIGLPAPAAEINTCGGHILSDKIFLTLPRVPREIMTRGRLRHPKLSEAGCNSQSATVYGSGLVSWRTSEST